MNFNVKFIMQPSDPTKEDGNNCVFLTVGLSGSGKSTYYRNISTIVNSVEELDKVTSDPDFHKMIQLNRDSMRLYKKGLTENEYGKLDFNKEFENEITAASNEILVECLKRGYTVAITNTNLNPVYYQDILHICKNFNVPVVCDLRMIDEKVYFERAATSPHWKDRENAESILKSMQHKFFDNSMPLIVRGFQELMIQNKLLYRFDSKRRLVDLYENGFSLVKTPECWIRNVHNEVIHAHDYFVCDVDGTLAHHDPEIREPSDNSDYSKLQTDTVDPIVSEVYDSLSRSLPGNPLSIIISGRYNYIATKDWLFNNRIHFDEFHCRGPKDRRDDWVIKLEIIYGLVEKYHALPLLAIDDRNSVVQAMRLLGVKVFQCEYGDF